MPKIEEDKKKAPTVARSEVPTSKVKYPKLCVNGIEIPKDKLKVTCAQMKVYLGWETEAEYSARLKREDKSLKDVEITFAKSDPPIEPLLVDNNGDKVVCWFNQTNRPFDRDTALKYAQDVLTHNWAGPTTMSALEGEEEPTVNGETMILDRYGKCLSIQHRGVGLVLACQTWAKQRGHYSKTWPEEPYLESLVVTGVSTSRRVVATLDNVRARTEADTIYTSDVFRDAADEQGNPLVVTNSDRRECSRMLAAATDLLWRRTGAGDTAEGITVRKGDNQESVCYQTHAASESFRRNHSKIMEAVVELFKVNGGRAISRLRLSAGQCSACLYLMATCESDLDGYRNGNPPSEELLDFAKWDRAVAFFQGLANIEDKTFKPVRSALADLKDDPDKPGRVTEKLGILAKAWLVWAEDQNPTAADCELEYGKDKDGNTILVEDPQFGGIDLGHGGSPPEPVEEEVEEKVEQTKEQVRAEKDAQLADRLKKARSGKSSKNGEEEVKITTQDEVTAKRKAAQSNGKKSVIGVPAGKSTAKKK